MEINIDINPRDCKNKSETKLPRKPKRFFISVLSGNIKFGSSGEQLSKEINSKIDKIDINRPKNSINLFIRKLDIFLNIFFISIIMNIINHFVSFNKYC